MALKTLNLETSWGPLRLCGGSRAGEGTLLILPQHRLALDIGRPSRQLTPVTTACLSHGHADHLGALAYWASQRLLNALGPARLCVPKPLQATVEDLLAIHARLEGGRPYDLSVVPVSDGDTLPLRRDFRLEFMATDHWVPTLGSRLIWVRQRLRPDLAGAAPADLAARRADGECITNDVATPLLAYGADTGPGLFADLGRLESEVLLLECSFWKDGDLERARRFDHLHLADVMEVAPRLTCKHLVLLHASRRTRIREAEDLMASALAPLITGQVHHLIVDWE